MIHTFWGLWIVRPWLEWTVIAYPRRQSGVFMDCSAASVVTRTMSLSISSSFWFVPGIVTMMFCSRLSSG